ncbi:zinc-dependent alcohol dehydrogenase family protein [Aeromicrobium sp.]
MHAWSVGTPGPVRSGSLELGARPVPSPGRDEVLVKVRACGVCRTDLHLAEGDLEPKKAGVVPGHQVVGEVVAAGGLARRFHQGERVGVAWLRRTCGVCLFCRAGAENLCPGSLYTGWDADGGFAEYCVVPEAYAYRLPDSLGDLEAAPLLCAGIIGYRSMKRANVPPGGRLGLYGFGSSAHITAQLALALGIEVSVMTRGEANRSLAEVLGATFVGGPEDTPPVLLDSAIIFAPAGDLVPVALRALLPGGTLALAGIHMSDIPRMGYRDCLFGERDLRTVTSNTRRDGEEFLTLAGRIPLSARTREYGFESVDQALVDIASDHLSGSAVMTIP